MNLCPEDTMKRIFRLFFVVALLFVLPSHGEAQKDVNKELLHAVTVQDGHEIIEMLALGADVNTRDDFDWTPLMIAADKQSESMIKLFIKIKADVNAKTFLGETALTIAIGSEKCKQENFKSNNHLIIKALIDAGADVNICNHFGLTPLLMASRYGHCLTADVLIDAKADVNKQDDDGFSPLMHAAKNGYLSIVEKLLANNANTSLKNKQGQNALTLAAENGHTEIVNILNKVPKPKIEITPAKIFFAIFLWIIFISLFIWNRRRLVKFEKEPLFGRRLLFNDLVWGFFLGLTLTVTLSLLSTSDEELAHLIGYYIGLWLGLAFAQTFFYFFFWWWKPTYLQDRFARNGVRILFYLYSMRALMNTLSYIKSYCLFAAIFPLIMLILIYRRYSKLMRLSVDFELEKKEVCLKKIKTGNQRLFSDLTWSCLLSLVLNWKNVVSLLFSPFSAELLGEIIGFCLVSMAVLFFLIFFWSWKKSYVKVQPARSIIHILFFLFIAALILTVSKFLLNPASRRLLSIVPLAILLAWFIFVVHKYSAIMSPSEN